MYRGLKLPDCVIVTPYMKVSLPRSGSLHLHREEPDSWTKNTEMEANYSGSTQGSILHHREVETYQESPFSVTVTVNAANLQESNEGAPLDIVGDALLHRLAEQLLAVTSNRALAQKFIDRINAAHNKVCASDFERIKSWEQTA